MTRGAAPAEHPVICVATPAGTQVTLEELANRIGARIFAPGRSVTIATEEVYAGDRISDLLNAAGDHKLLVSNLASAHLIRVAELMDIPGLCLVQGQTPDIAMIAAAGAHGTLLMVSPTGLFETCGRIYSCLREGERVV